MKCFHIFLIKFLNIFGHDYQKTERKKYNKLIRSYSNLKNKKDFVKYLERNKVLRYIKKEIIILGVGKDEIKKIIKDEKNGT